MRIVKIKKSKVILPVVAVCVAVAVLLTVRLSLSYLMDEEAKENTITLGNVSIKLDEGEDYIDSSVIAAGGVLPKAPKVTNTGTNDEYVFIRIAVPVRNVTLLYEENTTVEGTEYKEGQPTVKNYNTTTSAVEARNDEIFRTVADGHPAGEISKVSDTGTPAITLPQIDIAYNKGTYKSNEGQSKEGWIYIEREQNKKIDNTKDLYDFYYFGYNRRLKYENDSLKITYHWEAQLTDGNWTRTFSMTQTEYEKAFPSSGNDGTFRDNIPADLKDKNEWERVPTLDKTIPLFDRIQLKSFIDEELTSKTTENGTTTKSDVYQYFDVKAYAIQADDLGTDELNNLGDAVLPDDTIKTIFGIVKRQAGEAT